MLPNAGDLYLHLASCPGGLGNSSASLQALADSMALGNNTVYAPSPGPTVRCGGAHIAASDFLARGYDRGTTLRSDVPSAEQISGWARALLGMKGE